MTGADLRDTHMEAAVFDSVDAVGADFSYAQCKDASFQKANLQRCDFAFAELKANFFQAVLSSSSLVSANLSGASFAYADLRRCDMSNAQIINTNFEHAKMEGSIATNGRVWGTGGAFKRKVKKPWWQVWGKSTS